MKVVICRLGLCFRVMAECTSPGASATSTRQEAGEALQRLRCGVTALRCYHRHPLASAFGRCVKSTRVVERSLSRRLPSCGATLCVSFGATMVLLWYAACAMFRWVGAGGYFVRIRGLGTLLFFPFVSLFLPSRHHTISPSRHRRRTCRVPCEIPHRHTAHLDVVSVRRPSWGFAHVRTASVTLTPTPPSCLWSSQVGGFPSRYPAPPYLPPASIPTDRPTSTNRLPPANMTS